MKIKWPAIVGDSNIFECELKKNFRYQLGHHACFPSPSAAKTDAGGR